MIVELLKLTTMNVAGQEFLISLAWQMLEKNLSHKDALEVCKLLKLKPDQIEFLKAVF